MEVTNSLINIGAIDYLNALPLVRYLDEKVSGSSIQSALPSELAKGLRQGRFDIALVPQVECTHEQDYRVLPKLCIACTGAVDSILLFSHKEFADIKRVAIDQSSNSSVALLQVLFHRMTGDIPEFVPTPPSLLELSDLSQLEDSAYDAQLLIGDAALEAAKIATPRWDLGQLWWELTGLPFVFALWVGRQALDPKSLKQIQEAGFLGIADRESLAVEFVKERPEVGSQEMAVKYLENTIRYELGEKEIESIRLFYKYRLEANTVEQKNWELKFFDLAVEENSTAEMQRSAQAERSASTHD